MPHTRSTMIFHMLFALCLVFGPTLGYPKTNTPSSHRQNSNHRTAKSPTIEIAAIYHHKHTTKAPARHRGVYRSHHQQTFSAPNRESQTDIDYFMQGLLPKLPCRSIFAYEHNKTGDYNYGRLKIPIKELSDVYRLEVNMSVNRYLQDSDGLSVSLLSNTSSIAVNKSIEYEVKFPKINVLPTLIRVKFNNKIVCQRPTLKRQKHMLKSLLWVETILKRRPNFPEKSKKEDDFEYDHISSISIQHIDPSHGSSIRRIQQYPIHQAPYMVEEHTEFFIGEIGLNPVFPIAEDGSVYYIVPLSSNYRQQHEEDLSVQFQSSLRIIDTSVSSKDDNDNEFARRDISNINDLKYRNMASYPGEIFE